jgi:phosphatidylglycerophosphatase A
MMRRLMMTGFGLGYAPVASGTFGSAGAIAIALACWFVVDATGGTQICLDGTWVLLTVLATVGCCKWGAWAVAQFAGKSRKLGDPGQIVLDEFAGQWLALVAIPLGGDLRDVLIVMAVQFVLFRIFDVVKPPPARKLEKLPFGYGIVADDLAAGVYANVVGQIVFRLIL